ncbi:MAG: S8 family serine peptidase [Deltaproteobacteria bacterium]|nr:S8 family serine peptidase [Deltaproteobacteria bacterium]
MTRSAIIVVIVLWLAALGSPPESAGRFQPPEVSGLTQVSKTLSRRLSGEPKSEWQFHNPKLDSRLNLKLEKALLTEIDANRNPGARSDIRQGFTTEIIGVQITGPALHFKAIKARLEELGGSFTGCTPDQTTIQALIPLSALNQLAETTAVSFIKTPSPAIPFAGNYQSEALDDLNADSWHSAGIEGQGVKVGIIDVGFKGYQALLGSDLPYSVGANNFCDGESSVQIDSGSPHGTACAEVVHDIAPAAAVYLAKIYTDIDLQEAVTWLRDSCRVDIISTSLGWYNLTPGDGSGILAELVNNAYNAGILWVTAGGNDRQRHWGGLFSDPDENFIHNFSPEQEINYFGPGTGYAYEIIPGLTYTIYARWSDWENVDQDYDIYVYRWNGSDWELIANSDGWQDGTYGQTPTEAVTFTTSGTATAYGFIIYQFQTTAASVNFEIFIPNAPRLDKILSRRSLPNLADCARAVTVSAIDVGTYVIPEYSAEGPTNGPGGSADGGFDKPEIAAYTNITTASYGLQSFNGTSAATPHVAGAAALILAANPNFSPEQLNNALTSQALDIASSGYDLETGWGRLYLESLSLPDDTATWLGNSSAWGTAANWSNGAIPNSATSVIIPISTAGGYWPVLTIPAAAQQLTITGRLTITQGGLTLGR